MAFALTLFVEAANRRIAFPGAPQEDLNLDTVESCRHLYCTLCADVGDPASPGMPHPGRQTSLYQAFSKLFNYYNGDPLQAAVCARVLAFYFLMERSAGAALAGWLQEHPENPEFVDLHPAVIAAIAGIRLHGSVLVPESTFLQYVSKIAASSPEGQTS